MSGPETIEEAVAAMRAGDARALAGGTDLIPQLREGRRRAARIVDLKRIPELTAIARAARRRRVDRRGRDRDGRRTACGHRGRLSGRCRVGAADRRRAGPEPGEPRRQHLQCGAVGGRRAGADLPRGAGADCRARRARARCRSRRSSRGPAARRSQPGEMLVSILLPPAAPRSAGDLSALHAAARDGHRHRRRRGVAAARRGRHHRRGAHRAGLGRADADPRADGRAKARGRAAERARCSRRPAGSPRRMRGRSPTRAARPTIAARWWPC